MKKVTNRAAAALLLAGLIILGMGFYLFRLARDGARWASFYANESVYANGALNRGTILDRGGVTLGFTGSDAYGYADSSDVRRATLHVVGDMNGNIATGAMSDMMGWNAVFVTWCIVAGAGALMAWLSLRDRDKLLDWGMND